MSIFGFARARTRAPKLSAIGLLLFVSCSDSDSGGQSGGASRATARVVDKLRGCGVIDTKGDFNPGGFLSSDDPLAACFRECYVDASCDALTTAWCLDDSDDTPSERTISQCFERCVARAPGGFECSDGSGAWRCDGEEGCSDGADEQDCGEFVCDSGERVPEGYECDDEPDCEDGSDERGCPGSETFTCKTGKTPDYVDECDGYTDCADGSDELDCVSRGLRHQCDDGEVVDRGARCDRFDDCEDGSDELDCAELICP